MKAFEFRRISIFSKNLTLRLQTGDFEAQTIFQTGIPRQ